MTESRQVKVKVKKTFIVAIAFVCAIFPLPVFIVDGSYDAWGLVMDFLTSFFMFTGMALLFLKVSPMYISQEGLQGLQYTFFFMQPAVVLHWGEVDFDRIKRNKFIPLIRLRFSWFEHQNILFPGYFYIENSEEVLLLIKQYTKKYRDNDGS